VTVCKCGSNCSQKKDCSTSGHCNLQGRAIRSFCWPCCSLLSSKERSSIILLDSVSSLQAISGFEFELHGFYSKKLSMTIFHYFKGWWNNCAGYPSHVDISRVVFAGGWGDMSWSLNFEVSHWLYLQTPPWIFLITKRLTSSKAACPIVTPWKFQLLTLFPVWRSWSLISGNSCMEQLHTKQ